jgi:hypothetical protein
MRIIEQFIEAKTGKAELCEDGIAANEHFIAVIDGVTNKSSFSFQSKKPGRIAMELIREIILGLNPESDAACALEEINRHIRDWYRERGFWKGCAKTAKSAAVLRCYYFPVLERSSGLPETARP